MASPLFKIVEDETVGAHRFVRVTAIDHAGLAKALAPRIQRAYFDLDQTKARLRRAAEELNLLSPDGLLIGEQQIAAALEEELDAILPQGWKAGGRPKAMDVQRSELAEIIAIEVMISVLSLVVPARRLQSKEIPDQPTRGVDVLALRDVGLPTQALVVGEVKGSVQTTSPPAVISQMSTKLREVITDRRTLLQELLWLWNHADDQHVSVCGKIYAKFVFRKENPSLVLSPILVRTTSTYKESDPGIFKSNPDQFGQPILFVSVCIEANDLFDFAVEVYRLARQSVDT